VFNHVMLTEMHTAEPLVPDRSPSEFEVAIRKLRYKSRRRIDSRRDGTLRSDIHKFIVTGVRKNFPSRGRDVLLYLFIS
jgi:hypothetical protein